VEFEAFYQDSRDRTLRAVVAATGDPQGADEAVAEAYARAFQRWPRVRAHPNPLGWVVRTAINHHRSVWRRLRREVAGAPDREVADHHAGLDSQLVRAVWHLPARQREVVALRIVCDLSTQDTARALGIAPGTVTAHLHRALTTLRATMTRDEETAP
jgi:RNA polymerase sigma-70 factor (sigma-E family)